ncbi:MAG: hypothetical protein ACOC9R_00290 [bacterium]
MTKPFASSADTADKTGTLEVLADGPRIWTAERDREVWAALQS